MNAIAARLSIVSAALPQTDRRTLSQAWYDALHLGSTSPRPSTPSLPAKLAAASSARASAPPESRREGAQPHLASTTQRAERSSLRALGLERRRPPGPVARRIVRALASPKRRRPPASIVLRAGGGRVQIVVRRQDGAVRLIALCTPELRERVERALAEARYVLASPRC